VPLWPLAWGRRAVALGGGVPHDPLMRQRIREYRPFPADRRFVLAAMRAGRHQRPVHGLTSVDVTAVRDRLGSEPGKLSPTAYVVAAVGKAVALHPEVAAYRDWRGRLVVNRYVDVATMIEVDGLDGKFPLAHVVRDADVKGVVDISDELRTVKHRPSRSPSGRLLNRAAALTARIPGALRLFFWLPARVPRMRERAGTVTVTSVGMFMRGGGHGIGVPTIMTLTVLVGGMTDRPVVHDEAVVARTLLDLTVTVDHRIVDGGPIARFGTALQRIMESGEMLDHSGVKPRPDP
jgi:pyruvate/2-oxoglutarate dehydrogenase complex dihydrolipoamide acyltransferase (E2) component